MVERKALRVTVGVNQTRRHQMKALLALLAPLVACSQEKYPSALGNEDAALQHKFREIRGGELYIDAIVHTQTSILYKADGFMFPGGLGSFGPTSNHRLGYFGDERRPNQLVIPKVLRMLRYAADAERNRNWNRLNIREERPWLGEPVVDVTVPVASRIPDAALDRVRQYKGSLTLKLRLTPETILVGWEVKDGKSFPWRRDRWGNAYATDADEMVGGDFCERRMRNRLIDGNLKLTELKGWYIDPKTGQKIETDF